MHTRRSTSSALFLLPLLATMASAVEAQAPSEYELKAAFLLNFVRFVRWPEDAGGDGPNEGEPLELCVLGEDPFGPALDLLDGRTVGARTLSVRRSPVGQQLTSCHVLFVARSEQGRFTEVLNPLDRQPILTVGDAEGFMESGGLINFVVRSNKLRFTINAEAAQATGLDLSSKLLSLAIRPDGRD